MKKNHVKTAIIGLGNSGFRFMENNFISSHFHIIKNNKNYKILAVCDIDNKKLNYFKKKNKSKINTYNNIDLLIKNENIDLAVVATDINSHFKVINKLISNNIKSIVCEKPCCKNLDQFIKLKNKLSKKNINLFTYYPRRYHQSFIDIKNNNKNNIIIRIYAKISGKYYENACHLIDLISFLAHDKLKLINKKKNKKIRSYNFINKKNKFEVEILHEKENAKFYEIIIIYEKNIIYLNYGGRNIYSNELSQMNDISKNNFFEKKQSFSHAQAMKNFYSILSTKINYKIKFNNIPSTNFVHKVLNE